ncbi:MAG: F0F1 ATP synthase subunit A [Eubacterium sp.]|nr:F0F1 ATP synthase subunit A [Eubacterium sp.]
MIPNIGITPEMPLVASKEADFYIHELYPVNFFGNTVYITTTHVCTLIVMAAIIVFAICARRSFMKAEATGKMTTLSTITEIGIDTLTHFVTDTMGKKTAKKYITYIGTIFLFIFVSNTSGVFGLRPPTADYGTTLALALITFLMIEYADIRYNKWGSVKALFEPFPLFFPMNVISVFSTPLSMSLRLFGNILGGTVLMALFYGMVPIFAKIGIPAFLHAYFDLFSGAIQTYVFCMLTITFITDKRGAE